MAIKQLESPVFKSVKPDGSPNSLGTIGVYEAGTSFATTVTIWDTQTKDAELTNPVTLSSSGEKEIWFDGTVDIEVKDSDGNILPNGQTLNVNSSETATVTGNFNLVQNGSFETDTDSDAAPDSWTLSASSGGTIAIDATSGGQAHGYNGLKFTGTGSGGGTATSTKFDVLASSAVNVVFSYKSSAATTTNVVTINWYKFDNSASATASTTVYTLATGNPATWTTYTRGAAVPSDAVKGEIVLTGVLSSGTDKIGPTWFDDIQVISIPIDQVIFDANGNEILETASVASAVNNLKITNASTGNQVLISVEGEDDIGVDFNSKNSEEILRLRATVAAVNEVTVTNEATGSGPTVSATGADANIDFNVSSKGSGYFKINSADPRALFQATGTTNPSVADNAIVPFDTIEYDPLSDYNTGTYTYTPSIAGYYLVDVMLQISVPASSQANFAIQKNTTDQIHARAINSAAGLATHVAVANSIVSMNGTTDTLSIQNVTGAARTVDTSTLVSKFSAIRIAPL